MTDRLEYARVFADSDYNGKRQAQHFALQAIANVLIAAVEDERAARERRNKTQARETGKREMNALEMKTMKSRHENLRWVNGTRWLIWGKKRTAWIVYDRKRNQRKQQLIVTEDEEEAIKWLLYQEEDSEMTEAEKASKDKADKALSDSFLGELTESKNLFLAELADSFVLFLKEMDELASKVPLEAKTNDH